MLSLKESYRYINFLNEVKDNLTELLNNRDLLFNIKELHMKSTISKDYNDEEIEVKKDLLYDIEVSDLIHLIYDINKLIAEVNSKIVEAKSSIKIDFKLDNKISMDIDTAISYNKNIREFVNCELNQLINYKSEERPFNNSIYGINNDGNQVLFNYSGTTIRTINYDRNVVKKLYKKILNECDIISRQIDEKLLTPCVDMEMKYNIYDSTEDIINEFKKTKNI